MATVRTGRVLSWVREFDVGLRAAQQAFAGHAFGCARGDGHIRLGAANMVIYDSLSDKLSSITVVVDFLGKCQIF